MVFAHVGGISPMEARIYKSCGRFDALFGGVALNGVLMTGTDLSNNIQGVLEVLEI